MDMLQVSLAANLSDDLSIAAYDASTSKISKFQPGIFMIKV